MCGSYRFIGKPKRNEQTSEVNAKKAEVHEIFQEECLKELTCVRIDHISAETAFVRSVFVCANIASISWRIFDGKHRIHSVLRYWPDGYDSAFVVRIGARTFDHTSDTRTCSD